MLNRKHCTFDEIYSIRQGKKYILIEWKDGTHKKIISQMLQ